VPPSRRQPPRSTPPVRRPRVAGLRKPGATDGSGTSSAPVKATPSPAPRPQPPVAEPAPEVVSEASVVEPEAEVTVEAVEAPEEALEASKVTEVPSESSEPSDASEAAAKPSPRAKVRDTGQAKPHDIDEAEADVAADESGAETAKPKSKASWQLVLAGVLVVVGLLLAAGAVIFKIQADDVSRSTNNTALLDVARTAQVKDQVSKATEALFSYDYNNIAKTETAAADRLVNDEVRGKYNLLMGEVKRLAPQQKMVVTCKVTRSAVIRLEGDRADVMVFVDQSSTRADTNKTTAGSAQLHLNAELQGDKWKITAMNTYAAPGAPAQQSAPASPPASPAPSK
jgi:Mce-associated membrane protein